LTFVYADFVGDEDVVPASLKSLCRMSVLGI